MATEEELRALKQAYLREAILEPGYEPQKFVEYLESVKKGGADIDNWSLEELRFEVFNYKRYYSVKESPEKDVKQAVSLPEVEPPATVPEHTKSAEIAPKQKLENFVTESSKPKVIPEQEAESVLIVSPEPKPKEIEEEKAELSPIVKAIRKMVPTKKPPFSIEDTIQVSITATKVIDPGFFSYKYEVYVLTTPSKGYAVERKYSDFVDLRAMLKRLYPGYVIPALPKKPAKKLIPEILEKYKQKLQRFLNELLRHPLLRASDLFIKFISEKDYKEYEEHKRRIDKTPCPKEVSQCFTSEGVANIAFDSILESECGEMHTGVKSIQKELEKLKILNRTLVSDLERTGQTLNKISQSYTNISENYGASGGAGMFEIFVALGEAFTKVSDSCKQLQGMYEENFAKFFKVHKKEMNVMDELLQEWQQGWQQYTKVEKRLREKKEELFEKKQMDKWEIKEDCPYPIEVLVKNKELAIPHMLPGETKEVDKCKEIYGYFCNKVPEEFKRVWEKNEKDFRDHFSSVSQMCSNVFDRVRLLWNDLSMYLDSLKKKSLVHPSGS